MFSVAVKLIFLPLTSEPFMAIAPALAVIATVSPAANLLACATLLWLLLLLSDLLLPKLKLREN